MSKRIQILGNEVCLLANTGEWFSYDRTAAPLGGGAMGTVYFGRACNDHHFMVAIKKVTDRYASIPAIRARAKMEASMAFRHRNLIEMIGYCEEDPDEGPIFIISKLVQGVSLDKHVEQYRNSPDWVNKICRCMLPVLDALSYLHVKGIIHMDIKPTNIMVENGSNIRLMDLGIAYVSGGISSGNGGLLGTYGYAAPEQFIQRGQTKVSFDRTTDIYEAGATLYYLLSHQTPYTYHGDEDWGEKYMQQVENIPGVPKPIMQVIKKALQSDQGSRFQSAEAFKQALMEAMKSKKGKYGVKSGGVVSWLIPVLIGVLIAVLGGLYYFLSL